MSQLGIRRSLVLCLLLGGAPALAQPRVLGPEGERQPAKSADTLFAARVTKAAGLPLASACRLKQPEAAGAALAGRELEGEGERVLLEGLSAERLRFRSEEEARVAAGLLEGVAKVDARQPKYLTHAWGPKATPELLEKIETLASGTKLPAELGKTLGLTERARKLEVRTLRVPPPPPGFEGAEVRLEGLWVYKLRFASAAAARAFLARHSRKVKTRQVMDQVGAELVLLAGPGLEDSARAAKVLRAAWKGRAGDAQRGVIGAWSGKGGRGFALLSRAPGEIYERGASLMRRARGEKAPAGFSFKDPQVRNHLRFQLKDPERWGGVLLSSAGLLHVGAATQDGVTQARRYLGTLLEAVGEQAPQRAAETQPLLAAPR